MKIERRVVVANISGLHARPAAQFVTMASSFTSSIQVANLTTQSEFVDAKSILSVLALGAEQGHKILLQADGPDAEKAMRAMVQLVRRQLIKYDVAGAGGKADG